MEEPVLARTNDPVPYVHLASPGRKHACPNSAACWSPAIPAMGISAPKCPDEETPATELDGTMRGSMGDGMPNESSRSRSHSPVRMSINMVREALDGSETCTAPSVSF